MPTYEYKCDACGFEFEKFQSIKAAPIRKCPHCGKNRVKRLIGIGAGIIFKGGGFYQTDYRSEAYKTAAKADTADKPASTEAKSGASDSTSKDSSSKSATESKSGGESKAGTESKSKTDSKPAAESKPAAKSSGNSSDKSSAKGGKSSK
jgi:putative FmdB family regulatory protein